MTIPLPTRLRCGFPASLAAESNQAAYILDPDTGGNKTYTANCTIMINNLEYYVADLPIWPLNQNEYPELDALGFNDYGQIMKSKNPVIWYSVLSTLAIERGRELNLTIEQVTELCQSVKFDEELTNN